MKPLQPQLDAITANTRKLVQEERLAIGERSIAELFAARVEEKILQPGAIAPEFTLQDAVSGRMVRSSDLLALGPLVINFFRGRWCPYCMTELEAWRDRNATVRQHGGLIVGISPQTLRQNDFTVQQHGIPFPLLVDPGCEVAAKFGISYLPTEEMRQYYLSILVNIPFINSGRNALIAKKHSSDSEWMLPLPATVVVGQDGRIQFAEVHADFRVRPEPEDVLNALEAVRKV